MQTGPAKQPEYSRQQQPELDRQGVGVTVVFSPRQTAKPLRQAASDCQQLRERKTSQAAKRLRKAEGKGRETRKEEKTES